jgi:hypothetical protein
MQTARITAVYLAGALSVLGAQLRLGDQVAEITLLTSAHVPRGRSKLSDSSASIKQFKIQSATTLQRVLESGGWEVDAESVALVLELNGGRVPPVLVAGSVLRLPFIQNQRTWSEPETQGFKLHVDLDPTLRSQIVLNAKALRTNWDVRMRERGLDEATTNRVEELVKDVEFMADCLENRRHRPLRRKTLEFLQAETATLAGLLPRASTPNETWYPQFCIIEEDLSSELPIFQETLAVRGPNFEPELSVTIRILGAVPTAQSVRVYYTLNGLFRELANHELTNDFPVYSVGRVGPIVTVRLPSRNYVFWVAQEGTERHPLTIPLRQPVRLNPQDQKGETIIDLVMR